MIIGKPWKKRSDEDGIQSRNRDSTAIELALPYARPHFLMPIDRD